MGHCSSVIDKYGWQSFPLTPSLASFSEVGFCLLKSSWKTAFLMRSFRVWTGAILSSFLQPQVPWWSWKTWHKRSIHYSFRHRHSLRWQGPWLEAVASFLFKMKTCWVLSPLVHRMWELGQVSVLCWARLPFCQRSSPVWTQPTSNTERAEHWGQTRYYTKWLVTS